MSEEPGDLGKYLMPLKIMLVDDHEMIREGLHSLFECQTDMEIVGEAENGRVAVEKAVKLKPDLIVMDINMPEMNGIEATRLIKASCPTIIIVALSSFRESCLAADMIKAGASAYVSKVKLFEELVKAIQIIVQEQPYLGAVE